MPRKESNIVVRGNEVFLRICNSQSKDDWYFYDQTKKPLGAGAMGTVYQGRSCTRHELVAIKSVKERYANIPAIRERAHLEADMAFRHHNLIEMLGYCENDHDSGPIFIISRLIQGVPLNKYVEIFKNKPDRVERICKCAFPVMDALTYLHEKNIIHMDIKPSNIMVENSSNIRLMDLGIAYTFGAISPVNGGLLGTPGYAAPEQYVEKGQTELSVGTTTDIYELGATIYELLSGHKPYDKDKDRLDWIAGVPRSVMQVIGKSLKHDQSERYQTAAEFKAALQQALLKPTSAIPKWVIPVAVGIGAALILTLILLFV